MDKNTLRAADLVKQAQLSKKTERVTLVKQALRIDPDCVDAYLLLGKAESTPAKSEFWYRKAVAACRRIMNRQRLSKKSPVYITALWNLADELACQDKIEEAISYYHELLQLQSEENIGIRYSLLRLLIRNERYYEARQLIDSYYSVEDNRWFYDDLLLTYLQLGSCDLANEKAAIAIKANSLICQMLLEPIGLMEMHFDMKKSHEFQDEVTEVLNYIVDTIELWNKDQTILAWLQKQYDYLSLREAGIIGQDMEQLLREGAKLIEAGELTRAERILNTALSQKENLLVRNYLGYCQMLMKKFKQSMETLKIGLEQELNPFGNALLSECSYYLGDELGAHRYLRQAITQFEQGFKVDNLGHCAERWNNYTVIIKAVAGLLGNDQLVIDLHKKWEPYLVMQEDYYQLGVAFYNKGNYPQAEKIWSQLVAPEWDFIPLLNKAGSIFASGIIPAPRLEYLPAWYLNESSIGDQLYESEMLQDHGSYQIALISDLFASLPDPGNHELIFDLTCLGEWGIRFGKAILTSSELPKVWQENASEALNEVRQ